MPRLSEIVILILVLALDPGASPIFVLGEAGGENGSIRMIRKNLATKTPYAFVQNLDVDNLSLMDSCHPVKLWMLIRHGTRYPKPLGIVYIRHRVKEIAKLIKRNADRDALSVKLNRTQIHRLLEWSPIARNFDENLNAWKLHPEGEKEMILLAERTQLRFPHLLSEDYDRSDLKFRATLTQRAQQSQFYFATGLFDRRVARTEVHYEEPLKLNDTVLRQYRDCDMWKHGVKLNRETKREVRCFENTDRFRQLVLEDANQRLGFREKAATSLTLDDIEAIYVACTFGQAWEPTTPSPWCEILSEDLMQMMEYREDLKQFWTSGPPYEINGRVACFTLKDIHQSFHQVVHKQLTDGHEEDTEKAIFYFSHSGMVLKILTALGLFKDDLRCDNFQEKVSNRAWRTSNFDPFASNLAFVLNFCSHKNSYQVGLMLNEKLQTIPGCETAKDSKWCDYGTFENILRKMVSEESCNYDSVCSYSDPKSSSEEEIDSMF